MGDRPICTKILFSNRNNFCGNFGLYYCEFFHDRDKRDHSTSDPIVDADLSVIEILSIV